MALIALAPTQSPIQGVKGALSLGVRRLRREADNSPPSSAEVKEGVKLYLHSPNAFMACCSVKKSTGTTLLLISTTFFRAATITFWVN